MINSVNLNRAYNVKAYEHEGSIYYNLEDPNRFYYTMDGDWYQNGTMTISDADSANAEGYPPLFFYIKWF